MVGDPLDGIPLLIFQLCSRHGRDLSGGRADKMTMDMVAQLRPHFALASSVLTHRQKAVGAAGLCPCVWQEGGPGPSLTRARRQVGLLLQFI